ncbi:hypothetical protein ACJRO7_024474 [Eucalyptus globulus]|uniref:Uncharacterized protein n=1 Tax=Eucalyptus globulus TaxID=34317 RepID=A0ABD3K7R8_EUCGL
MGLQDGNSLLIYVLFLTCICTRTYSQLISSRHDQGYECQKVNCLMGTCRETPGTIEYQGSGKPPPPPPPPHGKCVASGKGHKCECHEGSANFLGLAGLPYFQQCNLGADCSNGAFVPPATTPPPLISAGFKSPPPPSAPPRNGSADASNYWRDYHALSWMLLVVAVLSRIYP